MATAKSPMTFASVTFQRNGVSLLGYAMDDGSFQFIIDGRMTSFDSLLDVWAAFAETQ